MAAVFTESSTVLCATLAPKLHGGTVTTSGSSKLTVSGSRVLIATSLGSVSGCKTVPPPMGSTACTAVSSVSPTSVATKLKAAGTGVLLETLQGVTNGTPPGDLSGSSAGQTKLTAV